MQFACIESDEDAVMIDEHVTPKEIVPKPDTRGKASEISNAPVPSTITEPDQGMFFKHVNITRKQWRFACKYIESGWSHLCTPSKRAMDKFIKHPKYYPDQKPTIEELKYLYREIGNGLNGTYVLSDDDVDFWLGIAYELYRGYYPMEEDLSEIEINMRNPHWNPVQYGLRRKLSNDENVNSSTGSSHNNETEKTSEKLPQSVQKARRGT